jgi:hypothetical protein
MAYVKITKTDTFESWRQKTNELGANLGDYPSLYKNATVSFTGITGQPPTGYAGAQVAIFSIDSVAGVYTLNAITTAGLGYSVGDVITVYGSDLGGLITTNDLTITVATIDGSSGVATVTLSGTGASNLQAESNLMRDELGSASLVLTTAAADTKAAINELDNKQGSAALTTAATDLSGAINELDATLDTAVSNISTLTSKQGNGTLTTAAADLSGAINELDARQGNGTLTTTATDLSGAINELDSKQGNGTLTTSAADLSGAINELDSKQGSAALTTTATDLSGAINELKTSTNTLGTITAAGMGTTATTVSGAITEVGDLARDAQLEIGGDMLTDYDGNTVGGGGGTARILDALNSLYNASSVSTLDGEYLKRDGTNPLDTGKYLSLSEKGITATDSNELVLNTTVGTTNTQRLRINPTTGNIGINKAPTTSNRVDVSGVVKATSFNENGTTLSTKYVAKSSNNTIAGDNTFTGSITISPSAGKSVILGGSTVATNSSSFLEFIQDNVADMFDSSGDLTKTYTDSTGKLSFSVDNNSHTHTASNITDWTESVTDTVGSMVNGNTESGIDVTFDDSSNKLNFAITGGVGITTDSNGVSITNNGVGATQLNVSGNGTTAQFLRSDGDGSFSWAVPSDLHTTYTTSIPSSTTKLRLSGSDSSTDDIEFVGGTAVTVARTNASKFTISSSDTTYTSHIPSSTTKLRLDASAGTDSDIEIAGGTAVSVTRTNANKLTISSSDTVYSHPTTAGNKHIPAGGGAGKYLKYASAGTAAWSTDTFDEDVADKVTAMVTSPNTESGISVSVDVNDKLSFDVNDPTITLSGDVTGSATMTNLGSININTTVAGINHSHAFSELTGTIATADIGDLQVTQAKIANDAINGAKIADDAINSEHYVDGSIDAAHLADNSVTQAKMADDSVGSAEMKSLSTLLIKNSAGTVLKTLHGAGA